MLFLKKSVKLFLSPFLFLFSFIRYMYWTDWGTTAKIEKASMDGGDRIVLHSTLLEWPNGLTIDYEAQRIYWVDASLSRVEFSNVDGTGRTLLRFTSPHPFSVTVFGNLLFWTDWSSDSIHVTHKTNGESIGDVYTSLRQRPFGIEAISPDRQTQGEFSTHVSACE